MGNRHSAQSHAVLINKLGTAGLDKTAAEVGTVGKRIFRVQLPTIHYHTGRTARENLFGTLFWILLSDCSTCLQTDQADEGSNTLGDGVRLQVF